MNFGQGISAGRRQAFARKILAGTPTAERPFRVEAFSGGVIDQRNPASRGSRHVTDQHVVDARGRTVWILPYTASGHTRAELRARAERIALGLNEVTA